MSVEVLVATMYQTDHSLLAKMNIQSDAIIGNQCDRNSIDHIIFKGHNITFLNFNERGVGLNRNNALLRASGDYCVFADDDVIFDNEYPKLIENAFKDNPKADVIVFNLRENGGKRKQIRKKHRINRLNYLRYGTVRIAIKLSSVRFNGIFFNLCFGGGTQFSHGEDNLFLTACLNKKLKIYAVPITLGTLENSRKSTWNSGYTQKYIVDQGILYKAISKRWWKVLCLQDSIRRHKTYKMSVIKTYKTMKSGEVK